MPVSIRIHLILIAVFISLFGGTGCSREKGNSPDQKSLFQAKKALIKVDGASLRIAPSTLASKIDVLPIKLPVTVIGRTEKEERIGSMQSFWFHVRLENNVEGWIYGTGLTFDENEGVQSGPILPEDELRKRLVGKWWELLPGGGTGRGRVYIWPEGEYRYTIGRKVAGEGKIEIDLEKNLVRFSEGSPGGKELRLVLVVKELRLKGSRYGKDLFFARGDEDPGSLEEDEQEEKIQEIIDEGEKPESTPDEEKPDE